jgi:hypothetical protein
MTYNQLKEDFYPLDAGSTIDDRLAFAVGMVLGVIHEALRSVSENRRFNMECDIHDIHPKPGDDGKE